MSLTSIRKDTVRSPASFSGLRSWCCCELWCRSQVRVRPQVAVAVAVDQASAVAPMSPLAWELPCAAHAALKKTNNKKQRVYHQNECIILNSSTFFFFFKGCSCVIGGCVLRLGVEFGLQLSVYTTATAPQDPSCVCDLHHNSQQQILNPVSEARDRTCIIMDASGICFH